jgi:hypothetical protein
MVKRVLRWSAVSFLTIVVIIGGFAAYLYVSPIPLHEFGSDWYHAHLQVTDAMARSFYTQHRWAVFRAAADHFVHPVKPGRIIILLGASSPNESGDVFLYFGSAYISSSADWHQLPVYCWSDKEQRLLWKGLQDNSP